MPGFRFEEHLNIRQQAGNHVVRRLNAVSLVVFVFANDRSWHVAALCDRQIRAKSGRSSMANFDCVEKTAQT